MLLLYAVKGCLETPALYYITVVMSAPRPRPWVTSGWSLRKSTGSPRISSSFNCWARLATCQGQSCRLHAPAQEIKASSFRQERASPPRPDSPSHAHLWHAAPAASPSPPFTPPTSGAVLLDWHILDEGVRGNYVSRAFQTHNFPKHMDIWGKEQLVT